MNGDLDIHFIYNLIIFWKLFSLCIFDHQMTIYPISLNLMAWYYSNLYTSVLSALLVRVMSIYLIIHIFI